MSDKINMVQAINWALDDAMAADKKVLVLGEDVADHTGGDLISGRCQTDFHTGLSAVVGVHASKPSGGSPGRNDADSGKDRRAAGNPGLPGGRLARRRPIP